MRHKATVLEQIIQQFPPQFPWNRFDHYVREHAADDRHQRGFTSRKHFLTLLAASLGDHPSLSDHATVTVWS